MLSRYHLSEALRVSTRQCSKSYAKGEISFQLLGQVDVQVLPEQLVRCGTYAPGWIPGELQDYNREFCVDIPKLYDFLLATQPKVLSELDLALFMNGLPVLTFELKNNLTKQTLHDAIRQHQIDRDPRKSCLSSDAV